MNLDVDLATNRALAKTIIELIRIIVDIENSTQDGDKPSLINLKPTTSTSLWNNIHVAIRIGQLIKNQINSKSNFHSAHHWLGHTQKSP